MKIMLGIAAALTMATAAQAQGSREASVDASGAEALSLTLYSGDLALVRERRQLRLPGGQVRVNLGQVPVLLRPETVMLRPLGSGAFKLLEQDFEARVLTPQTLLQQHVGREVTVLREHPVTGEDRSERATLLAAGNAAVLRFADRIETHYPGRIVFDRLPPGLQPGPTLSVLLEAATGPQTVELAYQTGGLSWKTDYVARLSADGRSLDLSGWITLANRSGTDYPDASLQLVAGSPNRVQDRFMASERMAPAAVLRASAEPTEETLLDYHLYRFERPVTIADQQTRQLALLTAAAVPVRREYLLASAEPFQLERQDQPAQQLKPSVYLEFDNRGAQLGQPLPAGVVRVYGPDREGATQFIGEDRIAHTARDQTIRLRLGTAFDLSAERRQTAFRQLGERSSESSWRLSLHNARNEAVTIRVLETLPGDWEIVQESQHSRKDSAHAASWSVAVPAGGSAQLDYTVRTRW